MFTVFACRKGRKNTEPNTESLVFALNKRRRNDKRLCDRFKKTKLAYLQKGMETNVCCVWMYLLPVHICLYHFLGIYSAFLPQMIGATTENDIPAPPLVQALVLVLAHDQLN